MIGFRDAALQAMTYAPLDGLAFGSRAQYCGTRSDTMLDVAPSWLGRVIDPLGQPLDGKGILFGGSIRTAIPFGAAGGDDRAPGLGHVSIWVCAR